MYIAQRQLSNFTYADRPGKVVVV